MQFKMNDKDKVQIKGKSGSGKTTFFKLLCSMYKAKLNTVNLPFHVSFSPQHPLVLPFSSSIKENLDPYHLY